MDFHSRSRDDVVWNKPGMPRNQPLKRVSESKGAIKSCDKYVSSRLISRPQPGPQPGSHASALLAPRISHHVQLHLTLARPCGNGLEKLMLPHRL